MPYVSVRSLLGILALAVSGVPLAGQVATVDDLRPPSSPAFVLLGIEPTSVTQPSSPRAVAGWALSHVAEGGVIPRNLAVEIAPYWLVSRPAFTIDDYFAESLTQGRDVSATIGRTIARSFALSTGSSPRLVDSDTVGSSLAFGARSLLWPGRAPRGFMDQRRRLEAALGECAALVGGPEGLECLQGTMPLQDSIRAGIREPVGFVLQLSGGVSLDSPSDAVGDARWRRAGVWISPAYRTERRIDWIFVGRYQRDRGDATVSSVSDLFDAGMRLTWRPSPDFAVSAEGLNRWIRSEPSDATTPRWGGLLEYRAREDWFLFYSFGKDFAAVDVPESPLFSSIGLTIGFGQKPLVTVR